jgi:hypothetical protein
MTIYNDKPWMKNVNQQLLLRLWRRKDDGSVFQWKSPYGESFSLISTKYGEIWISDAPEVAENQYYAKVQPDDSPSFVMYTLIKIAKKVVENLGGKFKE